MAWRNSCTGTSTDPGYVLISDYEYYQAVAIEKIPSMLIDGVPSSWKLLGHTLRVRDRVEEWRGLTKDAAFSIGGEKVEQAGNENFSFDKYSVKISRRRVNEADGWTVTKTTSWRALYTDNVWEIGAPENMFN